MAMKMLRIHKIKRKPEMTIKNVAENQKDKSRNRKAERREA